MEQLLAYCRQHNVEQTPPHTYAVLADRLFGRLVEPDLMAPTFVCGHPLAMSPLAKARASQVSGSGAGAELPAPPAQAGV